jgi:hypothetical protein
MDRYAVSKCLTKLLDYASNLPNPLFGTAMTRKFQSSARTWFHALRVTTGILGPLWAIHEGDCKLLTNWMGMHARA